MKLVLASASPRRAQILRDAGIPFETCVADIDESRVPNESGEAMVVRLAEAKSRAAAARYIRTRPADSTLIIGADTCVELDGAILGKPGTAAHAREMLAALSGRTHRVLTGIAVLRLPDNALRSAVETTLVTFAPLTPAEIEAYIATGEPFDKAGAYAIQGFAGRYIPRIEGCYFNVVGLPLARLCQLLDSLGWQSLSRPS